MTTRNFVPRNNNEGQLGTENKKWNKIYTNEIFATNFTGNLTGTADNAIKDNKNQQIDSTYIKDISVNNDTLIITKGNNDSQDITINNISHAISSDNAINASKLQGLTTGNKNGQIPINNGTENTNLNAALLNGKASSYFATSNHTHTTATQSSNGYMSNADKKKLDGIASGAEVNQNAFANVKVGSTTIRSDAKQDTLELAAGTNISLVGDANNDKVTIGVTGKVASASQADNATNATKATQDGSGNTITTHYLSRNQSTQNDMNACTVEGIYRFSGNLSNAWTGTSWGTLLVFNNNYNGGSGTGGTYLVQMALPTDGRIWIRQRVNTEAWSGWVKVAITSDTVAGATKATQDSQGQAINTTYIKSITASNATLTLTKGNGTTSTVTINNVGNSTRATQDKNGKDITGYLYKTEDLTLNSNAEILTVGNISEILNSFCTKFKQIQGTGTYAENSPTSIKSLNDNKAPKASPAFSGTPTSPTPATSDNSTKIATTEFVRNLINQFKNDGTLGGIVGGSLTQNGWVKFSNGLILQWGTVKGVANGKQYNFSISFINNILGAATNKNWRGGYGSADGNSAGIELINKTSFYAYGDDGSPNVNYIVIGY